MLTLKEWAEIFLRVIAFMFSFIIASALFVAILAVLLGANSIYAIPLGLGIGIAFAIYITE